MINKVVKISVIGEVSSGKTYIINNLLSALDVFSNSISGCPAEYVGGVHNDETFEQTHIYAYSHERDLTRRRIKSRSSGITEFQFVDIPGEVFQNGEDSLLAQYKRLRNEIGSHRFNVIECQNGDYTTKVLINSNTIEQIGEYISSTIFENVLSEHSTDFYLSSIEELLSVLMYKYSYELKLVSDTVDMNSVFSHMSEYNMNSVAIAISSINGVGCTLNSDLMKMMYPIWFALNSDHAVWCNKIARGVADNQTDIKVESNGREAHAIVLNREINNRTMANVFHALSTTHHNYHALTGFDCLMKAGDELKKFVNTSSYYNERVPNNSIYEKLFGEFLRSFQSNTYKSNVFHDIWTPHHVSYINEINSIASMGDALSALLHSASNFFPHNNGFYSHTYLTAFAITSELKVCRNSHVPSSYPLEYQFLPSNTIQSNKTRALVGCWDLLLDIIYHSNVYQKEAHSLMSDVCKEMLKSSN